MASINLRPLKLRSLLKNNSFRWLFGALTTSALIVTSLIVLPPGRPSQADDAPPITPNPKPQLPTAMQKEFDALRARYQDMTYEQLRAAVPQPPHFATQLPFDPAESRYFELIQHRLRLTLRESGHFKSHGLVTVDTGEKLNFIAAYQQIYAADLPVIITTDSILHALHKSYDAVLKELEENYFAPLIDKVLADCQAALTEEHQTRKTGPWIDSQRDVDLYLAVARALLTTDNLDSPVATSVLGQEEAVEQLLSNVKSLVMQNPMGGGATEIYGGRRPIDYSQFKPRGHYTESSTLERYFRCMMWLGRADCGWHLYPVDPASGIEVDPVRELRNAALLTHLLAKTQGMERLDEMEQTLQLLVGKSDNLRPFDLQQFLTNTAGGDLGWLSTEDNVKTLQQQLFDLGHGNQLIRSQALKPNGSNSPTMAPPIYQTFGQRFVIDSFALSKVVHDEITYQGQVVDRMRPTALDVAVAIGNDNVLPLLERELQTWNYSGNLMACRQFIAQRPSDFWDQSLYSMWIDSLRALHVDLTAQPEAPTVMKTELWQRKQLKAQLASWSELRHDTLLYAKQSYGVPGCVFPDGYVEPYPQFFARLKDLAEKASRQLAGMKHFDAEQVTHRWPVREPGKPLEIDPASNPPTNLRDRQGAFFAEMAQTMSQLESIARKELAGEAWTEEEKSFIRNSFDNRSSFSFGSSSKPKYDGWYCRLYYERHQDELFEDALKWKPTIADVHTNVDGNEVLEVGTGDVQLMVVAIDGKDGVTSYVGPTYSYYEFWHPVNDRLTDEQWQSMVSSENAPSQPDWTEPLYASHEKRPQQDKVTSRRSGEMLMIQKAHSGVNFMPVDDRAAAGISRGFPTVTGLDFSKSPLTDEGLKYLRELTDLGSLDIGETQITDAGLAQLTQHQFLQSLSIANTQVSDEGIQYLIGFEHLHSLDIRGTKITAEGLSRLRQAYPRAVITSDQALTP
ncbi:MAG: DUF3160 domain-containing protein [Pirellulales bacterium]